MSRIFHALLRALLTALKGGWPAGEDGVAGGGIIFAHTTAKSFVL